MKRICVWSYDYFKKYSVGFGSNASNDRNATNLKADGGRKQQYHASSCFNNPEIKST